MRLDTILKTHRIPRARLAAHLGVRPSTVTHWLQQGEPRRPAAASEEAIQQWLEAQGVPEEVARTWNTTTPEPVVPGIDLDPLPGPDTEVSPEIEDNDMLLRRQPLPRATLQHFRLDRDPFRPDLSSRDDVFRTSDTRYISQSMWTTLRDPGSLMAIVGESGSGKTTLLDDLEQEILDDTLPYVLIRPDVTGMELNDNKGRVLRVGHIQEAVIRALAPDASLRSSPQARADQMRRLLIAARNSGTRVGLAFDEAHCMPAATLKHLKRIVETKHGLSRLLSVILLGQPELGVRLSKRNPEVREVVQRCEVVTLDPLDDALSGYLEHKLASAGRTLDDLVDASGLDALRERLGIASVETRARSQTRCSRAYPLAVGNLLAASLNIAAAIGAPRVTAAIVGRVQ